mmetsp:Transcript_66995/g.106535  ORF Transcript_66995/g.106535 Transcript_66995/m.106535 type:complete len:466 (-) Transcript_66995:41-1438(-)
METQPMLQPSDDEEQASYDEVLSPAHNKVVAKPEEEHEAKAASVSTRKSRSPSVCLDKYIKTKYRCDECASFLVLVDDNKLYDGDEAQCDECDADIRTTEAFYHCVNDVAHPHGFDLCRKCAIHQQQRAMEQRVDEHSDDKQDKILLVSDELGDARKLKKVRVRTSKQKQRKRRKPSSSKARIVEIRKDERMENGATETKETQSKKRRSEKVVRYEKRTPRNSEQDGSRKYEKKEGDKLWKQRAKQLKEEKKVLLSENRKQHERIRYLQNQLQIITKDKLENETTLKFVKNQVSNLVHRNEEINKELNKQHKQNAKLKPDGQYKILCELEANFKAFKKSQNAKNKQTADCLEKVSKMEEIMSNMYQVFQAKLEKQQVVIAKLQQQLQDKSETKTDAVQVSHAQLLLVDNQRVAQQDPLESDTIERELDELRKEPVNLEDDIDSSLESVYRELEAVADAAFVSHVV